MRKIFYIIPVFIILLFCANSANAEFMVGTAILEFTKDGPRQQDIELISRSKDNDYLVSEVSEISNPGMPNESRKLIQDSSKGGLLVSPDKTILTGGGRKVRTLLVVDDDRTTRAVLTEVLQIKAYKLLMAQNGIREVLDSEQDKFTAETSHEMAIHDNIIAVYKLKLAMGNLSPHELNLSVPEYDPGEHYKNNHLKLLGL